MRPDWNSYWLGVARAAAARATCPRLSVGCVVVDQQNCVTVSGYNGAPAGEEHCCDVGCDLRERDGRMSCHRAWHAEHNAIRWAALNGRRLNNCTAYVTHQPCRRCMGYLRDAGVVRVVYAGNYPDEATAAIANEAGIELVRWTGEGSEQSAVV